MAPPEPFLSCNTHLANTPTHPAPPTHDERKSALSPPETMAPLDHSKSPEPHAAQGDPKRVCSSQIPQRHARSCESASLSPSPHSPPVKTPPAIAPAPLPSADAALTEILAPAHHHHHASRQDDSLHPAHDFDPQPGDQDAVHGCPHEAQGPHDAQVAALSDCGRPDLFEDGLPPRPQSSRKGSESVPLSTNQAKI